MKRIFIMDDDGLKEYVPLESLQKQKDSVVVRPTEEVSKKLHSGVGYCFIRMI